MNITCVALDLETTGLDPRVDEIIEIGAVKFEGRSVLDTFQTLVKPAQALPYRIQLLTGITAAELEEAPSAPVALSELHDFLAGHPVVGQSISFDLDFLTEHGLGVPNPAYDTFELAAMLLPGLRDYSLSALADTLDVFYTTRHRALPDAMLAKDVFLALLDRARGLDLSVIAEVERLAKDIDWPPALLFRRIADEKTGDVFCQIPGLELSPGDRRKGGRLAPASRRMPLDLDRLANMLGADGIMARAVPGFERRPEQVKMLAAVADALNRGEHLVVEAGTGTGKSMAYLVPASRFAVENGLPVVVSTNTINLQDQLIAKDIPDLVRAFEEGGISPPRYAQLKGRNNYLCVRRWNSLRHGQSLTELEARFLLRTLVWACTTVSGDRAELNLTGEEPSIWNRVCAQSESCLGARCPHQRGGVCFLHRARRAAEKAHILVVNHALLLSDLASSVQGRVIPDYSHLVVDEAHHLEEEATEQWGFEIGAYRLEGFLDRLAGGAGTEGHGGFLGEFGGHFRGSSVSPALREGVARETEAAQRAVQGCRPLLRTFLDTLSHFIEAHAEEPGAYDRRLRLTNAVRRQPGWDDVELAWENLSLAVADVDSCLGRLCGMMEPLPDAGVLDYDDLVMELGALVQWGAELTEQGNAAVFGQNGGMVYWASLRQARGSPTLNAAPLHVGNVLADELFARKECVVLTSATLSTEGGFEYVRGRLGLTEANELLLGSSFDYERSAMVYVPGDIPEPGQAGYQKAVEQVLVDLGRAVGGKCLTLFTSHSALRASYERIRGPLQGEGILVLGQGLDGSPRRLLETFKANPRSVLLGTSSFWEGVDIVGEALSVLVIARLPFSVPSDPVFAARGELLEDPFNQYAVPQAVLRFKQGFGRLIRSRSDRGVVVLLDKRVRTKAYGAAFIGSLPPCTVKSGPMRHLAREVKAWLQMGQQAS
ncbi:MAG: helicase C-terminal domain-containing protein [Chloroflexota bacterium]|nr:helicase C-terminal domain-containing protein [Chloroflexota bacterium]